MTTITRKIRKYMVLFEDLVIVYSNAADRDVINESEWRIKGFARHAIGEREALNKIGRLLEQRKEIEEGLRTWRQDFPHLFEDKKVSLE